MASRFIGLSLVSSAIIASFSSWQFIKIILWFSIVLIFFLSVLDKIKPFNEMSWLKEFIKKRNEFLEFINNYREPTYLLRVPIVSGLVLFFFPIIANLVAPTFLQNLFAMRNNWQLFLVMIASALTSILIISAAKTILAVYFQENNDSQRLRSLLTIGLVIPTWLAIYFNSYPKSNQEEQIQLISFILGLVISLVMFITVILYDWRKKFSSEKFNILSSKIKNLFGVTENLKRRRKQFALIQVLAGIFLYLLIVFAYRPESNGFFFIPEAPALLYLLLLIWIFTFLLSRATLLFDEPLKNNKNNTSTESNNQGFRFPILISLLVFIILSYSAWEVDHYFELIPVSKQGTIDYQEDFKMAIKNRLNYQGDKTKTLVVVAASGGGIQASGWTTQVLAGLQQEKELGEEFTNAIGLISSVSGGSVGTMFYLDQFDPGKSTPTSANLEKALNNSTDDWLDAVGWGLAYPDLFRAIGLPFLNVNKYHDRGYSLEKDWQKKLQSPESLATLDNWRERIEDGEIPIPVFNSTLIENGSRFLISPMKFIPGELNDPKDFENENGVRRRKALDFKTLYADACNDEKIEQDCDMRITTAARLSASFPYVTPMARNDRDNKIKTGTQTIVQNYHMADGGYFDNSGLFTAVEWLDEFLKSSGEELNIKKVLLIVINAFPDSQFKEQETGDRGLDIVGLGPLKALYGVKDSTQRARNIREFQLLSDRWENKGVMIKRALMSFPEGYNPPLSWRLTKQQKQNLKDAWETDLEIRKQVGEIKAFWNPKDSQNQV